MRDLLILCAILGTGMASAAADDYPSHPIRLIVPFAPGGAVDPVARLIAAPELPTMAETLPGFDVVGWYGLAAPARTPKDAVAKLNAEANQVLQSSDLIEHMHELSYEPIGGTPEEANARIEADVVRWTKIIHDAGIEQQ